MADFYIISVHHTRKRNRYILLWRPDNRGYTFRTSTAGRYDEGRVRSALDYYNSGSSNIAVPAALIDGMTVQTTPADQLDGPDGPAVLNTPANWRLLLAATIEPPRHKARPDATHFGRNAEGYQRRAA